MTVGELIKVLKEFDEEKGEVVIVIKMIDGELQSFEKYSKERRPTWQTD